MKNKINELDVDFIGGQEPMTKAEELRISEFIKKRKVINTKTIKAKKSKMKLVSI